MKSTILLLLIFAILLSFVSCARQDPPPADMSENSESSTESESATETVSHFPKERKLIVHSGTESFIPKCFNYRGYYKPKPEGVFVDYIAPPEYNAFRSISSSIADGFPTLYWNGELSIEVSEDCESVFAYVADRYEGKYADRLEDTICTEWSHVTIEELNALGTGTWYVKISARWNGDYYPEYEKYETATGDYCFALVVGQSYDRDLFLQSKMDVFKLGELENFASLGFDENGYKEGTIKRYQQHFDDYLEECKWVPDSVIRPDVLYEKLDGVTALDLELYDTGDGDENPRMVLYRYSLPTVYVDGKTLEFAVREYDLTVLHGDVNTFMTEEERAVFETGHAILTEHEGEDLRFCQAEGIVDYYRDGIRYTYANGELSEIHWESGDTKFWIDMLPAYFTLTESRWENNVISPILKRFLDKNQTATAIAWFDEQIMTP